jgi:hypothetical protein
MSATLQPAPVVQTAVNGTGATTILPASNDSKVYRDLVSLTITTQNAAASVLTISDGNKTVLSLDFPNAALAPSYPIFLNFADVPLQQSKPNLAWSMTPSVNGGSYRVTAQYVERQ